MSFSVVLFEPEIPPNTGNIMRLCANTGCNLHLIQPLGFDLDTTKLKRAGLDYRDFVNVKQWPDLASYLVAQQPTRIFACTTKGQQNYAEVRYHPQDVFLFGPESRGLPVEVRQQFPSSQQIYIPMRTPTRSLNLANAVAVIVYEAWRQCGWE